MSTYIVTERATIFELLSGEDEAKSCQKIHTVLFTEFKNRKGRKQIRFYE